MSCRHGRVHQIDYDAFECCNCGMVFFGIDKNHPQFQNAIDYMRNGPHSSRPGGIDPNLYIRAQTASYSPYKVDLGSMPQDVLSMKDRMGELEETLSVFAEILKSAIQT